VLKKPERECEAIPASAQRNNEQKR
jgi:hypothetical protein